MKAVIKPRTERQPDQTTSWDLFFVKVLGPSKLNSVELFWTIRHLLQKIVCP